MPTTTETRQRLVGLITVLLVILAITVVLAVGSSKPKQSEIKVETISGQSSLGSTKHFPAVVSTTTTTPVLVEVQRFANALSKYLSTVVTVPPRPVVHRVHHVTPLPASVAPVVAVAGSCEAMVQSIFPEVFIKAMQIVHHESRCTAGAFNGKRCNSDGSHAYGVFQLCLPLHADLFTGACAGKWTDLYCNVTAARRLYDAEGGWYPAWG